MYLVKFILPIVRDYIFMHVINEVVIKNAFGVLIYFSIFLANRFVALII